MGTSRSNGKHRNTQNGDNGHGEDRRTGGASRKGLFKPMNGPRAIKRNDWICQCGYNNFEFRSKCLNCDQLKPQNVGGPLKKIYIPDEISENDLYSGGISTGINFDKYSKIPVEVTDDVRDNVPKAIASFEQSGLNDLLLVNIKRCNYTNPTPIQKSAIPIILGKRDLMACAQTGSGKTAAFLLPIIQTLMAVRIESHPSSPYALIVTPTRELTTQV